MSRSRRESEGLRSSWESEKSQSPSTRSPRSLSGSGDVANGPKAEAATHETESKDKGDLFLENQSTSL